MKTLRRPQELLETQKGLLGHGTEACDRLGGRKNPRKQQPGVRGLPRGRQHPRRQPAQDFRKQAGMSGKTRIGK